LLPTADPKQNKLTVSGVDIMNVTAELPNGQGVYQVIFNELPEVLLKQPNITDQILDTVSQQVQANMPGAKVVGDPKKITLGEYPGRELTAELQGKTLAVRFYLVKSRVLQILAMGSKEMTASKDTQKFFDSFKLTDK
jgi:hypothetical protein